MSLVQQLIKNGCNFSSLKKIITGLTIVGIGAFSGWFILPNGIRALMKEPSLFFFGIMVIMGGTIGLIMRYIKQYRYDAMRFRDDQIEQQINSSIGNTYEES